MDFTNVYQIISNNKSTVESVLQVGISTFLTAFFATIFLPQNTARTEFEKYKAKTLQEAVDELFKSGQMSPFELRKCNNFSKIAKKAEKIALKNGRGTELPGIIVGEKSFDFDWFMRFFEAAGNISDEDIQDLWAKVLAGALQQEGRFSLRALETLRNMSKHEAEIFQKLVKYITFSYSTYFLFDYGFGNFSSEYEVINPIKKEGLTFAEDICLMQECGIITDMYISFNGDELSFEIGNQRILGIVTPKKKGARGHRLDGYVLTSIGIQLFNSIMKNEPSVAFDSVLTDDGMGIRNDGDLYLFLCLKMLKASNSKTLDVKAYILKKPYDPTNIGGERTCIDEDILSLRGNFIDNMRTC